MRATVEAKSVKLAESEPTSRPRWVLATLPSSSDIKLLPGITGAPADESFRQSLLNALGTLKRQCAGRNLILEIAESPCSLGRHIRDNFAKTDRRFIWDPPVPELRKAPATQGGGPKEVNLRFKYMAGVDDGKNHIQRLRVVIETAFFSKSAQTERVERNVAAPAALPPGMDASKVDVVLRYSPADQYPNKLGGGVVSPLFSEDDVQKALSAVALSALSIAVEKGLVPGQNFVNSTLTDLEDRLKGLWNVDPRSQWPLVVPNAKSQDGGVLEIFIRGVTIVRKADVALRAGDVAAEEQSGQRELRGIRQEAAENVAKRHRDKLDALVGTVPTRIAVDTVAAAIAAEPELADDLRIRGMSGFMVFWSNFRYVFSNLNAKVNADIAADPQQPFTLGGDISGERLFYLIPRIFGKRVEGSIAEVHTFTAKGGKEFQSAEYNVSMKRALWSGEFVPALALDYGRDRSQRLGRSFDSTLQEIARGIRPALKWSRKTSGETPADQKKTPWSRRVDVELALPMRHTRIQPRTTNAVDLINGQVTAGTLDTVFQVGYDFSPASPKNGPSAGAGRSGLSLHVNSQRAFKSLGGDYTFWQHAFEGDAELPFGFTRIDQFKIHYRRGIGTSGSGTPLFSLFRLGGSDNLRGVELGEYVGRNISFDQSEFSYNLFEPIQGIAALIGAIRNRRKPVTPPEAADPAANNEGESPSVEEFLQSNGISNLFIKGFYDRGRVTDTALGLGNLLSLEDAPNGIGIGLELGGFRTPAGRINLTIARARSSHSYVHKSAVWLTGISIAF